MREYMGLFRGKRSDNGDVEIIGNIHDNPELLKEGADE